MVTTVKPAATTRFRFQSSGYYSPNSRMRAIATILGGVLIGSAVVSAVAVNMPAIDFLSHLSKATAAVDTAQLPIAEAELGRALAMTGNDVAFLAYRPIVSRALAEVYAYDRKFIEAQSLADQLTHYQTSLEGTILPDSFQLQAMIAERQGNYARAYAEYRQLLRTQESADDRINMVRTVNYLSHLYLLRDRVSDASDCLALASAIEREEFVPLKEDALTQLGLAEIALKRGDLATAESRYLGVVYMPGADLATDKARANDGLANVCMKRGEFARALEYADLAQKLSSSLPRYSGYERVPMLSTYILAQLANNRPAQAAKAAQEAVSLAQKYVAPWHPYRGLALERQAQSLQALGRHAQALVLYEQALRSLRATLGVDHHLTEECIANEQACRQQLAPQASR